MSNKIIKKLKYASFEWNEDKKILSIIDGEDNIVSLNKIYSFALMRFIIRIAQRNFLKAPIGKRISLNKNILPEEDKIEEYEDPNQKKFDFS